MAPSPRCHKARVSDPTILVAASVEATATAGDAPEPLKRIRLLPMGEVRLSDGRGPYQLRDRAHAEAVIAASAKRAGKSQLFIDYEHAYLHVLNKVPGAKAPAAAWITKLAVEDDGIWGDVEWTPAAAQALREREYRYISPLFTADPKTDAVLRIANAGLVNAPAITDLAPVAASQEGPLNYIEIAKALGLAEPASLEDILAAIAGMTGAAATVAAAAKALGLADGATPEQLVAAAQAKTPSAEQYVPAAAFVEVRDQLAALTAARLDEQAESFVAAAAAAHKITPAMRDWALGEYKRDPAAMERFIAVQPVVVAAGAQAVGAPPGKTPGELTPVEKVVAAAMGLTEDKFIAAREAA